MMNNSMLVGRITNIKIESQGKANLSIAVQRQYKNEDGEYDVDIIPFSVFQGVSESITEHCKVGDLIGVKGRLQISENILHLVVDRVTFLQSRC